jgi:thymidylate synthase (FAD)
MVVVKFMVQVPMDCWRQWVRHRMASINEYSTRYTEALDFFQVTNQREWRTQSKDNKQGSSGYLETWPENWTINTNSNVIHIPGEAAKCYGAGQSPMPKTVGEYLSTEEEKFHKYAKKLYKERLDLGIAREQARKDLPLSTYTRAYWKSDLRNIFNFLKLRMDSHAQLEIRQFANAMFDIIKPLFPVACEAFEDYVLHAKSFSRMEMEELRSIISHFIDQGFEINKPASMTDREWKEFIDKIS